MHIVWSRDDQTIFKQSTLGTNLTVEKRLCDGIVYPSERKLLHCRPPEKDLRRTEKEREAGHRIGGCSKSWTCWSGFRGGHKNDLRDGTSLP